MKKTKTYTKINTLYKRYKNLNKVELPNKDWKIFQNKIMVGEFSDQSIKYLQDLKFDCFCKIDGTNTKIVYYPSEQRITYGGKTDNADLSMHNKIMPGICEKILPKLKELYPVESARFVPALNDSKQIEGRWVVANDKEYYVFDNKELPCRNGLWGVEFVEAPVYIYGELFGGKVQKGGNYSKDLRFSVFDICQQGWWLPVDLLTKTVNDLGLNMVPYYGQLTILEAEEVVRRGFTTMVDSPENPNYLEEGLVARPVTPMKDSRGERVIVKIKYEDYASLHEAVKKVGEDEYRKFVQWYKENENLFE